MKAYQIFQELSPETARSVFRYLRDEEREVYSASLASLATNRKLRPVFIQRKPAPQQIDWLVKNIRLKSSEEIAEHVIQLWLMKAHQPILVDFLDGVGIEHDGEGAAEDLPEKIDEKKLAKTVDSLLSKHDPELVRVYLHVFQLQQPGGWEEIDQLIEKTPALQFGEPEASTEERAAEEEAPAEAEAPAQEKAPPAKKKSAPAKKTAKSEKK